MEGSRADASAILGAPMESFLDRLLADEGAAVRQPAPRPAPAAAPRSRGATEAAREPTAAPGATDCRGPAPDGPLPDVPLGLEAPRIAIYDTLTSPPRVIAVEEEDLPALIASLAEKTYHYCREQGGQVPYSVIQELIENLLHAYFRDVVITILDNGQTIRISDHGPGVDDKDRAFQPGFTTATAYQRQIIRGVGSGPAARARVAAVPARHPDRGGQPRRRRRVHHQDADPPRSAPPAAAGAPEVKLTTRQTKVLVLLMELGSAGPTAIAKELGFSPATVFRELVVLQDMGLIHSLGDGKRALREEGLRLLESIL